MMKRPLLQPVTAVALAVVMLTQCPASAAKIDKRIVPLTVDNPFTAGEKSNGDAPLDVPDPHVNAEPTEIAGSEPEGIAGGPVNRPGQPPVYRLPPVEETATDVEGIEVQTDDTFQATPDWWNDLETDEPASAAEPLDEYHQEIEDWWNEPSIDASAAAVEAPEFTAPAPEYAASVAMVGSMPVFEGVKPPIDMPAQQFNAAASFPYTMKTSELSEQMLPAVQEAFALAKRGALYAAEVEFIQVLRRVAQAKDAELGTDVHSRSLAAGLRALDEAEDFMPDGVELEAEMNVAVIASSHRTPVLGEQAAFTRPHDAVALYHRYAEGELGRAAGGERAGAMALYGIGKISNRLALDSDDAEKHQRKALTMFLATLTTAPHNHLAANEVGVLLARGGHHAEAVAMFKRSIDLAPLSTTYHNLAVVEKKLGQHVRAAANEQYAQQLAARDRAHGAVSRRQGVTWVTPDQLARVQQPMPLPPAHGPGRVAGPVQAAATPPAARPAPPKSPWEKTVELAKSLPLPGKSSPEQEPVRVAGPMRPAPSQWRY